MDGTVEPTPDQKLRSFMTEDNTQGSLPRKSEDPSSQKSHPDPSGGNYEVKKLHPETRESVKISSGDESRETDNARRGLVLSAEMKRDIAQAFNAFDVSGSGYMTPVDLRVALKALGYELSKSQMKKLLEDYDSSGGRGNLCFTDFLKIIQHKMEEHDRKADLQKAFKLFDKDKSGAITFQNLRDVADDLGEEITDEEIGEMIQEADLDEDGSLDEKEFIKFLKKSLY